MIEGIIKARDELRELLNDLGSYSDHDEGVIEGVAHSIDRLDAMLREAVE